MHRPPDRGPLLWAVPPTKNQRKTGELAVPGTTQPALPSGDVQAGPRCHARVEGPGLGEPLKHRPDWTGSPARTRWPVCLWFALVLQPPRQARCSLCSNAWLAGVHAAAHIFLFAGALQAALRPQGPGKRQETRDVTGYENCMSALIFRSLCLDQQARRNLPRWGSRVRIPSSASEQVSWPARMCTSSTPLAHCFGGHSHEIRTKSGHSLGTDGTFIGVGTPCRTKVVFRQI